MDMQTPQLQAVIERLEKVEGRSRALAQQNRRLKLVGVAALAVIPVLVLSCGANRLARETSVSPTGEHRIADLVRTKELQIVDDEGAVFATLCLDEHGPLLALYDEKGKARAKLSVAEDGPRLSLNDENGNSRVDLYGIADLMTLSIRDEGVVPRVMVSFLDEPSVTLFDEHAKAGLTLGMNEDGPALVLFGEEDDKPCVVLGMEDGPGIVLIDQNYKIRARLSLDKNDSPSLKLYDKDEKLIWQAPPPAE